MYTDTFQTFIIIAGAFVLTGFCKSKKKIKFNFNFNLKFHFSLAHVSANRPQQEMY